MPESARQRLQIEDDAAFHRLGWRARKWGWALLFAIAVAGLAGLLGDGPLSDVQARSPDGAVSVRHERFAHRATPATMWVRYGAGAVRAGEITLWADRSFLGAVTLEAVVPQPLRSRSLSDRVEFSIAAEGPGEVAIHFRHDAFGRHGGRVGAGGSAVDLAFFVYP